MAPTIAFNAFARRQTPESSFAHFDGSEALLLALVGEAFDKAVFRNEPGTVRSVPVPPAGFYTAVRRIELGMPLQTNFAPRAPGEEPVSRTVCAGKKVPARHVEVILYHRDLLDASVSTDAEWEIVSINGSPSEGSLPMDPVTMARNQLVRVGGSFQRVYTPEEWAESVWFWTQHCNVDPSLIT